MGEEEDWRGKLRRREEGGWRKKRRGLNGEKERSEDLRKRVERKKN